MGSGVKAVDKCILRTGIEDALYRSIKEVDGGTARKNTVDTF